ncbi:MAG: hypothetical protein KBB55_03785 [Candidatus Buchananbacteria bacterium]|nr:hypothetical protein [Candidatus Buchananbacteria bacterium]
MSDGGTLSHLGATLLNETFALIATLGLALAVTLAANRRSRSSKPDSDPDNQP